MTQSGDMQESLRFARFRPGLLDLRLYGYTCVLWLGAGLIFGLLVASGERVENVWPLLALGLLGAVAERSRVRLSANLELSISLAPQFVCCRDVWAAGGDARGGGFAARGFSEAVSEVGRVHPGRSDNGRRERPGRAATVGLVAGDLPGIALATCAAAVVALVLDTTFASTTVVLRRTGKGLELARTLAPVIALSVPLYTPIVALLSYAYDQISPWTLPLFLVPAIAAQRLFGLYQDQRRLADDLTEVNERLERANISFATALVTTLDARDQYTAGHSAAVADVLT